MSVCVCVSQHRVHLKEDINHVCGGVSCLLPDGAPFRHFSLVRDVFVCVRVECGVCVCVCVCCFAL